VNSPKVALYATAYPAVRRFLPAWYESVTRQTDDRFDLWLGVDAMSKADVVDCLGTEPAAEWVVATDGDTGSTIRLRAMQRLVDRYDAVVFVDCDDVMIPSRIAAAREALEKHDVVGCALRVIDDDARETGAVFMPEAGWRPEHLLPRHNVFGLSNTAYRTAVLRRGLPFPADCVLIDWFLITRAWLGGADLWFDTTPHMYYRQYAQNIARVVPPFHSGGIIEATLRVLSHYAAVLSHAEPTPPSQQLAALRAAQRDVVNFAAAMRASPSTLAEYTRRLNAMPPRYVWWWAVANPELRQLWN
jgi:hypothetical protein